MSLCLICGKKNCSDELCGFSSEAMQDDINEKVNLIQMYDQFLVEKGLEEEFMEFLKEE